MVSEKKKVVICFALGKKLLFKFEFTETVSNFGQNFPSGGGGRLLSLKSQGGGGTFVKKVWGRQAGSIAIYCPFLNYLYGSFNKEARF